MSSVLLCRMTLRAGSELHQPSVWTFLLEHFCGCFQVIPLVLREKENLSSPSVFGAFTCTVDKSCHSVQLSADPIQPSTDDIKKKKISAFHPLCLLQDCMNFRHPEIWMSTYMGQYEYHRGKQWTKSLPSLTLCQSSCNGQVHDVSSSCWEQWHLNWGLSL